MSNQLLGFELVKKGTVTANNTTTSQIVLTGGTVTEPSILVGQDILLLSPGLGTVASTLATNIFATGFSYTTATANVNKYNYFILRSNNVLA